ncbi:MAG: aminoglycoside 6-adenylyltransferase [Omnitrophica WOR_2 bacterium]
MPTIHTRASIQNYLDQVCQWAAGRLDLKAVTLVGSYARDAAKATSDIDIVLLVDNPSRYLEDTGWTHLFGKVFQKQVEDYGKVTSVRIWYEDGREVEYGLTTPDWASLPLDEGTKNVIDDGMLVLYDPGSLFGWMEV